MRPSLGSQYYHVSNGKYNFISVINMIVMFLIESINVLPILWLLLSVINMIVMFLIESINVLPILWLLLSVINMIVMFLIERTNVLSIRNITIVSTSFICLCLQFAYQNVSIQFTTP